VLSEVEVEGRKPPPTPPKEGRSHSRFLFPRGKIEMGVSPVFIIFVFVYVNVFVTVKPFPL